jgi:hypothetical protein
MQKDLTAVRNLNTPETKEVKRERRKRQNDELNPNPHIFLRLSLLLLFTVFCNSIPYPSP